MGFNRTLAEVEAPGDSCVRQPLRHQFEHFLFPLGEFCERLVVIRLAMRPATT